MYRCSTTGVWILWIHFPLSDFGEKNSNLGIKNRSGFRFSQRNERVATWGLKSLITRASLAMRAPVQTCVATRDAFRSLACQFNLFCIPCDYLFFCFVLFFVIYFFLFLAFFVCQVSYRLCKGTRAILSTLSGDDCGIFQIYDDRSHSCASRNRAH